MLGQAGLYRIFILYYRFSKVFGFPFLRGYRCESCFFLQLYVEAATCSWSSLLYKYEWLWSWYKWVLSMEMHHSSFFRIQTIIIKTKYWNTPSLVGYLPEYPQFSNFNRIPSVVNCVHETVFLWFLELQVFWYFPFLKYCSTLVHTKQSKRKIADYYLNNFAQPRQKPFFKLSSIVLRSFTRMEKKSGSCILKSCEKLTWSY